MQAKHTIAAVALLALTFVFAPAFADDARKVQLGEVVLDAYSNVVMDDFTRPDREKACGPNNQCKVLTVKAAIVNALGLDFRDDQPGQKMKKGALALRVIGAEDMAFSGDDLVLIKENVKKLYSPVTAYRVVCAVDPVDDACKK